MTFQMPTTDTEYNVLHFDNETREYLFTEESALIKAGEGIPAYSTIDPLPPLESGQVAVRNGTDFEGTAWVVVDDNRNKTAYAKDVTSHEDYIIKDLNPLPSTHTIIDRPGDLYMFNETSQLWELDSDKVLADLQKSREDKILELTSDCEQAIQGGISSLALGTAHNYDTRRDDQKNLIAAWAKAQASTTANVRCNDPSGQLGFIKRPHTANQIRQVLADFNTYQETQSDNLTSKISDVNSASTRAAVEDITWS